MVDTKVANRHSVQATVYNSLPRQPRRRDNFMQQLDKADEAERDGTLYGVVEQG